MGKGMAHVYFCSYSTLVVSLFEVIEITLFISIVLYQNTYLAYRLKNGSLYILQCKNITFKKNPKSFTHNLGIVWFERLRFQGFCLILLFMAKFQYQSM